MLSRNQLKLLNCLQQKKCRNKNKLFIVEGIKGVNEFLRSDFVLHNLFCTNEFKHQESFELVQEVTEHELKKISNFNKPNEALAIFEIPKAKSEEYNKFTIALDGVNDPGNLGTIIRLCDWFGVEQLICSLDTVDCYNSKVVQSTMGSLTRVSIIYMNLKDFILETSLPVYSTMMSGENVYNSNLPDEAVVVMGNEANGVSQDIDSLIMNKMAIPKFGNVKMTESLNVATATAILLSEFKRP